MMITDKPHFYETVLEPFAQHPDWNAPSITKSFSSWDRDEQRQYSNACRRAWNGVLDLLSNPRKQKRLLSDEDFEAVFIYMLTHHLQWLVANTMVIPAEMNEKYIGLPSHEKELGYMPPRVKAWFEEQIASCGALDRPTTGA